MARNEEKQLARLNRVYLQQQREEQLIKNPKRPKLNDLNTADDVKKWLPSIKEDISYYISQSAVPCYPQRQIDEFNTRIEKLQGEYKAFLRKLKFLDPNIKETPWTNRPYNSKKRSHSETRSSPAEYKSKDGHKMVVISTPILKNTSFKEEYGYQHLQPDILDNNVACELQNKPLRFEPPKSYSINYKNIAKCTLKPLQDSERLCVEAQGGAADSEINERLCVQAKDTESVQLCLQAQALDSEHLCVGSKVTNSEHLCVEAKVTENEQLCVGAQNSEHQMPLTQSKQCTCSNNIKDLKNVVNQSTKSSTTVSGLSFISQYSETDDDDNDDDDDNNEIT